MSEVRNSENQGSAPWPMFGQVREGGEIWRPASLSKAFGRSMPGRLPLKRCGPKELEDLLRPGAPRREAPTLLSEEQEQSVLKALASAGVQEGVRRVLDIAKDQPLPGWPSASALSDRSNSSLRGGFSQRLTPESNLRTTLLVTDWRQGALGIWSPLREALKSGERLIILVDEVMPELFTALHSAMAAAQIDLTGICAVSGARKEIVNAIISSGTLCGVQVAAEERQRANWQAAARQMNLPQQVMGAKDRPFGSGVLKPERGIPLEFLPLRKRTLVKASRDPLEEWMAWALKETFGFSGAFGGWGSNSVGAWILPDRDFSKAADLLLERVESDSYNEGFPNLEPSGAVALDAVSRLALGKGATLLHTSMGSKGPKTFSPSERHLDGERGSTRFGVRARIPRQIFTNVELEIAQSMGAWLTPTLALCRGDSFGEVSNPNSHTQWGGRGR